MNLSSYTSAPPSESSSPFLPEAIVATPPPLPEAPEDEFSATIHSRHQGVASHSRASSRSRRSQSQSDSVDSYGSANDFTGPEHASRRSPSRLPAAKPQPSGSDDNWLSETERSRQSSVTHDSGTSGSSCRTDSPGYTTDGYGSSEESMGSERPSGRSTPKSPAATPQPSGYDRARRTRGRSSLSPETHDARANKRVRLSGSPEFQTEADSSSDESQASRRSSSTRRSSSASGPLKRPTPKATQEAMVAAWAQASAGAQDSGIKRVLAEVKCLQLGGTQRGLGAHDLLCNKQALMEVPYEQWVTIMGLMPNLRALDIVDIPMGVPLFERLVLAGLALEDLSRLAFVGAESNDQDFHSLKLQLLRMKNLRYLQLPGEAPEVMVAPKVRAGLLRRTWTSMSRTTTTGASLPQPTATSNTSLHAMPELRTLRWDLRALTQRPLDLGRNGQLRTLALHGQWDNFIAQGTLPPLGVHGLDLSRAGLTEASGKRISALPWALEVKRLDVSGNPLLTSINLDKYHRLKSFNASGSLKDAEALVLPAPPVGISRGHRGSSQQLSDLNISGCKLTHQLGRINLFAYSELAELALSGCELQASDLESWALPERNNLRRLDLSNNALGGEGIRALTMLPMPKLEVLNLKDVAMDFSGALALVRHGGTQKRWPNLTRIDFGHVADENTRQILAALTDGSDGKSTGAFS